MDGSDWIVVLCSAALIPVFVLATIYARRAQPGALGEEIRTTITVGNRPDPRSRLQEAVQAVVAATPGCTLSEENGIRFVHRGLSGRLDFISNKTEIQAEVGGLIRQVVEVVPVGFPMSLLTPDGDNRLRARGSKKEYDRIFKSRAEEQILMEIGVPYELRIAPEGLNLRLEALPKNSSTLGYWLSCVFRIVDLIPGVELAGRVEVTGVTNQISAATLCQVCGSTLAKGGVVRCALCSTPHHEDCWQYTGKCSTFGCRSLRHIR
jgi:hypothetical protein